MYVLLLTLHIIGVATWLGANFVLAFVGATSKKVPVETQAWWAETQGKMARTLYNVAGVLVLLTGIGLTIKMNYKMSSGFVSVGFLAVIIGAVLGMAVFGPGSRKLVEKLRSGADAEAQALNNRLAAFGMLDTAVVVVTIVAMVAKWKMEAKP